MQGPAVEGGFHIAQLGHLDAVPSEIDRGPGAVRTAVDGEGILPGLLGLELGVAEGTGIAEKVQKGPPQVLVDGAQGLAVHLLEEGGFLFITGRGGDILQVRGGVKLLHIGQHLVPQVPAAVEGFVHQLRLLRRGIEAELEDGVLRGFRRLSRVFRCFRRHARLLLPVVREAGFEMYTFPNGSLCLFTTI